ncbi:MAG: DUF5103 domain-containing protein [Dysgonamonadaceae bacterium]|jgi:hypothetical protein|nr:DUF5103 domain-containing protein [Dysgonamonadaceae bacterium]
MKTRIYSLFIFIILIIGSLSAQSFKTESFSDLIKTLRVSVVDDWESPPIIELEGGVSIEVSFDEIAEHPKRYTYTLTHCDAEWKPSQLSQHEYMSGFQNMVVEDFAVSFGTYMDYINYKLYFPNENLTMKVSGNYVVQVFEDNNPKKPVLSACFSVVEPQVEIDMQVSSRTDISVNRSHQQVSFNINFDNREIFPMQDIKAVVQQNNRRDNSSGIIKPISIGNKQVRYEHNPKLIFEGGNEYRKFEVISFKYSGLGIESMSYHTPYYHADIRGDNPRTNRFSYDEDADGKYVIRNRDGVDYDTEADYFFAHFYLAAKQPYNEDIYVLSEIFNNVADERSKMEYSEKDQGYIKTVILKQGYYNYLYVTKKRDSGSLSTALIEGNYYQAENEYCTYVYYRPSGNRYDKLIGFKTLKYRP